MSPTRCLSLSIILIVKCSAGPHPARILRLHSLEVCSTQLVRGQPGLEYFPFYERYEPPPPPEPGQRRPPEEIEAELKKQEKELEKLSLITINLPETVLWFEPPIIVGWNEKHRYWDTSEFHDIRFNEEKQSVSFRTGLLSGPIALASYRYSNLPFQAWDIRPGASDTVILSLTASVLVIELTFKDSEVCLSSLQNGSNNALQDIVGTYYSPSVLMKKLRGGGVDVFPQYDAMCYIEGPAGKHTATENHLYHCMAMVCASHNFAWSRWNLLAGRKNLVLQMREFIREEKLPTFKTLLVTPLKTTLVDCTEVSQSFVSESLPDIGGFAVFRAKIENSKVHYHSAIVTLEMQQWDIISEFSAKWCNEVSNSDSSRCRPKGRFMNIVIFS